MSESGRSQNKNCRAFPHLKVTTISPCPTASLPAPTPDVVVTTYQVVSSEHVPEADLVAAENDNSDDDSSGSNSDVVDPKKKKKAVKAKKAKAKAKKGPGPLFEMTFHRVSLKRKRLFCYFGSVADANLFPRLFWMRLTM